MNDIKWGWGGSAHHQNDPQESNGGYGYADCWRANNPGNDCNPATSIHTGIDLNVQSTCGKKVYAAADGVVRFADYGGTSWSGIIMIQHRTRNYVGQIAEVATLYGHVAPLASINEGNVVHRGQLIAFLANGSNCRGTALGTNDNPVKHSSTYWHTTWNTHLHFEVRADASEDATHWYNLSTYENDVAVGVCAKSTGNDPLLYRDYFDCRRLALGVHGYTDPVFFVDNNPPKVYVEEDKVINRCISTFSNYFGARIGDPQWPWSDGYRFQQTRGGESGAVLAIAYSASDPNYFWYYWGGWHKLSSAYCAN
jgi:murein DD-endopeptidase MepM/ murein hydrolase activator NlpD